MANFDWQLGIALLCVASAVVLLVRRIRALLGAESGRGCSSSGCGGCASKPQLTNLGEPKAFVSLEALERARTSGPDFTHIVKSDGKAATTDPVKRC